jgi:hypothetical protein
VNKKVHQGDVSAYVKTVDLISLVQKYNYKEHEGEDGCELLLDAFKLAGTDRTERIPSYRGIFQIVTD